MWGLTLKVALKAGTAVAATLGQQPESPRAGASASAERRKHTMFRDKSDFEDFPWIIGTGILSMPDVVTFIRCLIAAVAMLGGYALVFYQVFVKEFIKMINNKTRGYLTILLLLLVCATTVANAQSEKERIERIAFSSAVFIQAGNYIGSGFFVAHNLIATNYHVIRGAKNVQAFDAATREWFAIEGATAIDPYYDLAILKTTNFSGNPLTLGNSDNMENDDTVYVAGYPSGKRSFGKGKVKRLAGIAGCSGSEFEVTTSTRIAPGSSGGPVLNSSGNVIGISVRITALPIPFFTIPVKAFAVRVNHLRDLFNQQSGSVKYRFPTNEALYACGLNSLGVMRLERGEYWAAIADFDSIIAHNPGFALAHLNRAVANYQLRRFSEAKSDFNTALSLARSASLRAILEEVRNFF